MSISILLYFLTNPSSFTFTYQCKFNNFTDSDKVSSVVEPKPTRSWTFSTGSTFGLMAVDVKFNVNSSLKSDYNTDYVSPEPLPTPLPEIRVTTQVAIRDDDGVFGKKINFLPSKLLKN